MDCFNPRNPAYKTPYGAVPTGTSVEFTLRPLRSLGYSGGQLVANFEGYKEVTLPLIWTDTQEGYDCFTVTLPTHNFQGLVWYCFQLTGLGGREEWIRPASDPVNGVYQLTIYQDEQVPTWFGQGMCYQIFPDRFHRTSLKDPAGMVGERTVHQDWNDQPDYLPNAQGEVRNRDFFGGDLKGITEKLDYLQNLGVETLYFCPIFEAPENHRYGTADYDTIDPMLGNNDDFTTLCQEAHKRDMKVMLDGVFNHAGFVSRYFNGDGHYKDLGASQSKDSPYYDWFDFKNWPDEYDSWWGIYSLPSANEQSESYQNFIYGDKDSVVRRWLRAGADGWRLDVADELPDFFVHGIHQAARAEKPEAVVIGEVWEDGSTKEAYGVRRKHVLGGHCDGLMNYPFRWAALDFFHGGNSENFVNSMETLRENYPKFAFYSNMNALGTHDTLRILTLLGHGNDGQSESKTWRFEYELTPEELNLGRKKLKSAMALLFSFPGAPTVYYGDEAGMTGFEDPFNRQTFPWGNEDQDMIAWFSALGSLRKTRQALRSGDIAYLESPPEILAFTRTLQDETLLCLCNNSGYTQSIALPWDASLNLLAASVPDLTVQGNAILVPPYFGGVLEISQLPEEAQENQDESPASPKATTGTQGESPTKKTTKSTGKAGRPAKTVKVNITKRRKK